MILSMIEAIEDPGDQEFMGEVCTQFIGLMFFTVKKYVNHTQTCEDLVQDTFVKLIGAVERLRTLPPERRAGYIVASVKNTAINYLRKENQLQALIYSIDSEGAPALEAQDIPMDEFLIIKEALHTLDEIWSLLDQGSQYVLDGKYILGLSDAELAPALGCAPSSVRMALTRARRKAYKLFSDRTEAQAEGGVLA